MKVEIQIENARDIKVSTSLKGEIVAKVQFEATISPVVIARLLNMQKQGPISVLFSSSQLAMDLGISMIVEKDGQLQQIGLSDKEV